MKSISLSLFSIYIYEWQLTTWFNGRSSRVTDLWQPRPFLFGAIIIWRKEPLQYYPDLVPRSSTAQFMFLVGPHLDRKRVFDKDVLQSPSGEILSDGAAWWATAHGISWYFMGFRGVSWGFIWCFIWFEPWPWPVLPRMLRNLRVPRSSTTGCETEAAQARLRHANATIAGSDQRKNRAKTVEDVLFDRRTAHLTTIDITISYHILPRGVGLHSSLTLEIPWKLLRHRPRRCAAAAGGRRGPAAKVPMWSGQGRAGRWAGPVVTPQKSQKILKRYSTGITGIINRRWAESERRWKKNIHLMGSEMRFAYFWPWSTWGGGLFFLHV